MTKKKLDLAAFKVQDKGLLDKSEDKQHTEEKIVAKVTERLESPVSSRVRKGRVQVGRPPKNKAEKQSRGILLNFTEGEFEIIKQKAGAVPLARYLRIALIEDAGLLS